MWYVIQTTTGKEQELVDVIHKLVSREFYHECFVIKREFLKRLGGRWIKVTERLFPSYVFIDTGHIDELYYELKRIPEFARILGNENQKTNDKTGDGINTPKESGKEFVAVLPEEENFFTGLCDEKWTVKLSMVSFDEHGYACISEGPLKMFHNKIERFNIRKRYAVVSLIFGDIEKDVRLGIKLETEEDR